MQTYLAPKPKKQDVTVHPGPDYISRKELVDALRTIAAAVSSERVQDYSVEILDELAATLESGE